MADNMAGILVGAAIAIFVSKTVLDAVGLNTGIYATVITSIFPLIVLAAATAFVLRYFGYL